MPLPRLRKRPDRSPYWFLDWCTVKDGRPVRIRASLAEYGLRWRADEPGQRVYSEEEALREVMLILNHPQEPVKRNLAWFRDEIVARCEMEGLAPGTVKLYRDALSRLAGLLGESFPVADVTRAHVIALQKHMTANKLSGAYTNMMCRHLRAAFERLVDDETIDRNPFRKYQALAERQHSHLTVAQIEQLLAKARELAPEYIEHLIYIYLGTGRRLNEILLLSRTDVDLDACTIRAFNSKAKTHQVQAFDPAIRLDFKYFLDRSKSDRPFAVVHGRQVERWIKLCMRKAKLPESFKPHSLRHTFTTLALMAGESIWKVKENLGHSTVRVTERYAHDKPSGAVNTGIDYTALKRRNSERCDNRPSHRRRKRP